MLCISTSLSAKQNVAPPCERRDADSQRRTLFRRKFGECVFANLSTSGNRDVR